MPIAIDNYPELHLLEVCTDCAQFIANGLDFEPGHDWPGPDSIESHWPGHDWHLALNCGAIVCDANHLQEDQDYGPEDGDTCDRSDCEFPIYPLECEFFSWSTCDACESGLGGSRHYAVAIPT